MTRIEALGRLAAGSRPPGPLVLLVLLVLLIPPVPGAAAGEPAELAGRWILTEQLYEGGGAGLTPGEPPLILEIGRVATGLEIVIHRGETRADWPGLVTDQGMVPVTLLERSENPDGSGVRVLWRARPGGEERGTLEVEQVLTTGPEGTLEETVRVALFLDGEARGGYTLTRRYEREGGRP